MKKSYAFSFLVLGLAITVAGCTPATNTSIEPLDDENQNVNSNTNSSADSMNSNGNTNANANTNAAMSEAVTVQMTAKQWEFIPATVTVNQGDKVKLVIASTDVDHGIALPDFGVNERLKSGTTTTVEFIADKAGTFSFFCNVLCGTGHREMKGTLIVK